MRWGTLPLGGAFPVPQNCVTMHLQSNAGEDAMSEATFTFRVDEALKNEFSTAARGQDRTGAQLLRDFMRDYVRQQKEASEYDAWLRAKVQQSQTSANAGNLISAVEVEAKFAALRAATRRRIEAAK